MARPRSTGVFINARVPSDLARQYRVLAAARDIGNQQAMTEAMTLWIQAQIQGIAVPAPSGLSPSPLPAGAIPHAYSYAAANPDPDPLRPTTPAGRQALLIRCGVGEGEAARLLLDGRDWDAGHWEELLLQERAFSGKGELAVWNDADRAVLARLGMAVRES